VSALQINGLFKSFASLIVTNNVSLSVSDRERHVIIGPNGAGKTSLINQIGGQLRPDRGTILLGARDITGWPPHRASRAGVARTFQRNNLFLNLTVIENLRIAVQARRGQSLNFFRPVEHFAELLDRARRLMQLVHLEGNENRQVASLSYGEQRQLEIGMALAGEPTLLLLDEPTSGMSPSETKRTIDMISNLPRELALVMIEHDMDVVFSIADRITVLHYGEVLATDTPQGIRANDRVREIYLGSVM
jgi:branched-chain amino acid transport system ATP-binding protein